MPRNAFEIQLTDLQNRVLDLGREAGHSLAEGVDALRTQDRALAHAIIAHDAEINRVRYEIEEACYTLIATQQPLASDLRDTITILLIAIELERIADHGKNLAELVLRSIDQSLLRPSPDLPRMAELTREMLDRALEAFARRDAALAREVTQMDDRVDELYVQVFRVMLTFILQDPRMVGPGLNQLFAAHNLERAADRVTNIGERVIYAATGRLEELNVDHPFPEQRA